MPLRMKILPGRIALKTLDPMALCTDFLVFLPPLEKFNSPSRMFRMYGCMQETAGFNL